MTKAKNVRQLFGLTPDTRRDRPEYQPGAKVWNFDKSQQGVVVGTRDCALEGCRGIRLITKWPDGKRTMPCTRGMEFTRGSWKIT